MFHWHIQRISLYSLIEKQIVFNYLLPSMFIVRSETGNSIYSLALVIFAEGIFAERNYRRTELSPNENFAERNFRRQNFRRKVPQS